MRNEKRSQWWELITPDRKRESQLNQDSKEVLYEIVYQEWKEGKTYTQLADEYNIHKSTVWRIIKEEE